jgi:glutamate carboxypeptidase
MNTKNEQTDVISWLGSQQHAMQELLQRLVDIDSSSYDKPGIDAVGNIIRLFLGEHGLELKTLPQQKHGDCIRASVPWKGPYGGSNKHILLMGHRDTVFPAGEAACRPFTVRDGVAFGPGVADMKAGLVMNAFVLAAFARFGGSSSPLVGLFTGDEEIGSPEGRAVIEAEAKGARVVFNSEPGRVSGNVVTGRKGGVFMRITIAGKAAHSGGNFQDGISAIEELARKVTALHAITDTERGTTVNVGLVSGGQSVNTVAPWAQSEIDLRYVNPDDRETAMAAINTIVGRSYVAGTSAILEIRGEFLPVIQDAASARLFDAYADAAAEIGFTVGGEFTGGCADSGFAAQFAPTLCGVGPVGGKAHSPDEFLRLETLVPRAQACARAILNLDSYGL